MCIHLVPYKVNSNSYMRFTLKSKVCAYPLPFSSLPTGERYVILSGACIKLWKYDHVQLRRGHLKTNLSMI